MLGEYCSLCWEGILLMRKIWSVQSVHNAQSAHRGDQRKRRVFFLLLLLLKFTCLATKYEFYFTLIWWIVSHSMMKNKNCLNWENKLKCIIVLYNYKVKFKLLIYTSSIRFFKSFCNMSFFWQIYSHNKCFLLNSEKKVILTGGIFFFLFYSPYFKWCYLLWVSVEKSDFSFSTTNFSLDIWDKNLIFHGIIFLIFKMGRYLVSATWTP